MGTMAAALVRLLGAQGQEIAGSAASMQTSIAGRVFGGLGPLGAPSRRVHDAVSGRVHGLLHGAFGGVGRLGGVLAEQVPDEVLLASPRGRSLVGAVLGLVGDRVRDVEPDLAWPTVLTPVTPRPDATEVVVLLHGLCETDLAWGMGAGPDRPALPSLLDRPGREVLVATMNSGLRPSELGREVAALLAARAVTPVRVVLVGHSMGGLVARAALRSGTAAGHDWVAACDALVTLGTPHLGAPLERAVAVLVRAGAPVAEVAAVTNWFEQRSAGIRDLRHGVDDDGADPGLRVVAAPLPSHVRLHTVGAALPGRTGVLLGDGLVTRGSAHARGVRQTLEARRGEPLDVVGSHFDLLTDRVVTRHVVGIVEAGSPALEEA